MPDIAPSIPVAGQPNVTEEPKIVTALTQLVAAVNNVDTAQLADAAVTAAKIETQQAWQSIALAGGWTGSPDGNLRYYKNSLGEVVVRGDALTSPAVAVAAGTLLCTLPAGYRPGSTQYFLAFRTDDSNIITSRAILSVATSGAVTYVATGAGGVMGSSVPYTFSAVRFRAE